MPLIDTTDNILITHKLIDIECEHPTWFDALRSGSFQDAKSLEQEAAHLLKAGADWLEAAAKSMQPAAPKPK